MIGWLVNLRYAVRSLLRAPKFAAAAVGTLTVGVAASAAIFSVVYGVLIRPLPFPNASRLVDIVQLMPSGPAESNPLRGGLTPEQLDAAATHSRTLASIGFYGGTTATVAARVGYVHLNGAAVSPALLAALGVKPIQGRLFAPTDGRPGVEPVMLLSDETWEKAFGGDPKVVGTLVSFGDAPRRVIGVMPAGFAFPYEPGAYRHRNDAGQLVDAPEFWVPALAYWWPSSQAGGFSTFAAAGTLRAGATVEQARAELDALLPALPLTTRRTGIDVVNVRDELARSVRPVLLILFAAGLLVLLVACINVANLQFVRAATRDSDAALQMTFGGSRGQVLRRLVAEGSVLALVGSLLGCLLASDLLLALETFPPGTLPRQGNIHVDGLVVVAVSAVALAVSVVVSMAVARRVLREEPWRTLQTSTSHASRSSRPPNVLVVAEIATASVLLVGATLLLNSFIRLTSVDPGFDPSNVLTFQTSMPSKVYGTMASQMAAFDAVSASLRRIPGVTSVSATVGGFGGGPVVFPGVVDGVEKSGLKLSLVEPGLLETVGARWLRGRKLEATSSAHATEAIVNETFVRQYLDGADAIGHQVAFSYGTPYSLEIVGVIADMKTARPDAVGNGPDPTVYFLNDGPLTHLTWLVRSTTNPLAILPRVPDAVRTTAPTVVAYDATTLEQMRADDVADARLYTLAAGVFALVALLLATVGLYGVIAYSVNVRARELGIRMALGASPRRLTHEVVRQGVGLASVGVAIGLAAALGLAGLLRASLFGIQPTDALTFASVAVGLLLVTVVACYIPARRVALIQPAAVLKAE